MSNKPERRAPRGPEPQDQTLSCLHCGTARHLFISSILPQWPVVDGAVQVSYSCTGCGGSYRHLAKATEFAGVLNPDPGSLDLLIFSGHYIHCGQSMQKTATGIARFGSPRSSDGGSGKSMDVRIEVRLLECPCGFGLVVPE
jgi:hypothetical protein